MRNKCDICNEWHGSCVSFTDDIMGRAEHYICPNCLMWSTDPIVVKVRLSMKGKKAGKNGNKQK